MKDDNSSHSLHLILCTELDEMTWYSSSIPLLCFKTKQMLKSFSITERINSH